MTVLLRSFTLALFCCATAFSQSNIPILKQQLEVPTADSIQLLYELSKQYEGTNTDSCFYFLKASLDIAQRQNKTFAIAQAMCQIGDTYAFRLRNDAKAIEWINKAILVAKKANDNLNLARSYQTLCMIATFQNSNKAEELLSKALIYAKAANNWSLLATTYDCMGEVFLRQKRYKDTEKASFNAMQACENHSIDDWFSYGLDYVDLLFSNGKKEESFAFSQKLNSVRNNLTHSKGEFVYLMDLTRLDIRLKQYASADSTLQHALTLEKAKTKPDSFHLLHIYRNLLSLYVVQGSTDKVYEIIEDLTNFRVALKEKRLTQDSKVKVVELKSALELEQKEAQIALLDEQKKQQWLFLIGTIVIAVLLSGFMFVLQRNKRRIEQQKAELIAINATKDKLFSIVAHDLRSPIGALKNLMIITNYGMMSQAEFTASSKKLTTDVNVLFQSLENLLHWSYSQQKGIRVKPENISLHAIANEEIQFLTEIANQKGIAIVNDISPEATAFADPNQIGLVIRNLVSNSLKFTNVGGKISLKSQNTEGGKTTLKISDNGIGMPQELQNQLFKIQSNTSRQGTSEEKGQGLGLILVKEMVEANGGTLHIESAENQGTIVQIVL